MAVLKSQLANYEHRVMQAKNLTKNPVSFSLLHNVQFQD